MKVDKLVPTVYYKESRDFSFIGRMFEVVLNYLKTSSELVKINLDNKYINSNIIDLGSLTLGFESKHQYITKDLIYIISAFSYLTKNKGTYIAIDTLIRLLCNSQNIKKGYKIKKDTTDVNLLLITLPEEFKDIILLEDLLDYILPTGMLYKIILGTAVGDLTENKIDVTPSQIKKTYYDSQLGKVNIEGRDYSTKEEQSKRTLDEQYGTIESSVIVQTTEVKSND